MTETSNEKMVKKEKAKPAKKAAFLVYLGPTIRGVIQSGAIFTDPKDPVLSAAKNKYPSVAELIATDRTIATDRVKVKTPGNFMYNEYIKLSGRE